MKLDKFWKVNWKEHRDRRYYSSECPEELTEPETFFQIAMLIRRGSISQEDCLGVGRELRSGDIASGLAVRMIGCCIVTLGRPILKKFRICFGCASEWLWCCHMWWETTLMMMMLTRLLIWALFYILDLTFCSFAHIPLCCPKTKNWKTKRNEKRIEQSQLGNKKRGPRWGGKHEGFLGWWGKFRN